MEKKLNLVISAQTLAVIEAGMDSLLKTGGLMAFDKVGMALSEIKSQLGEPTVQPTEKVDKLDG